jgi:hypothetical protein
MPLTSSCRTGCRSLKRSPPWTADEKQFVSQIQGRTYANIFGLVERFINAKVLELSEDHWFGDQTALEALVRFSDEELKHQALLPMNDGLPKLKDFPAELGGSGMAVPE